MNTHTAVVDGRAVQYSVVRVLVGDNPQGGVYCLPHRQGTDFLAVCRECGFGVAGLNEEQAAHLLLATMNGAYHGHDVSQPCPRVAFDPQLIDHLYEAYDPEGATA